MVALAESVLRGEIGRGFYSCGESGLRNSAMIFNMGHSVRSYLLRLIQRLQLEASNCFPDFYEHVLKFYVVNYKSLNHETKKVLGSRGKT